MLTVVITLPVATALAVLCLPRHRPGLVRAVALGGAAATLVLALALAWNFGADASGFGWRQTAPWIPAIGASYDVAVTGLSLPLVVLTAVIGLAALVYARRTAGDSRFHAFLLLLIETGLLGVFCAQDLLLFYLFFEIALVPMYFLIGVYGHERRRYAAMKFFLYTRIGSLAMLLGFLALYLSMSPHTFSLPAIAAAQPLAAGGPVATFVFFALLLGFGIKLPAFPVHNWLPDAHVEAPAEGSAVLAGLQLKMGAYGLVYVLVQTLPGQVAAHAWLLNANALASLVYGAFAALGQHDIKRLVAFTSVNHMGYVLLAVGIWGLAESADLRALALTGASYQMLSHGLLTGAMFLAVGIVQEQTGTRELGGLGGLLRLAPVYAGLFAVLAFGSLGLPGLSGFIAELQVIGATVDVSLWAAAATILSLAVITGVYLRLVTGLLLGDAPEAMPAVREPRPSRLAVLAVLAALSLLLGLVPGPLVELIETSALVLGGGAP